MGCRGRLRDAGYTKSPKPTSKLKRSGLDHSKRAATSLFYLPSQAANRVDSFFEFYDQDNRQPLDPEAWLRNVRLETPSEPRVGGDRLVSGKEVAAAVERWRGSPSGSGNEAFYALAVELARLGMADDEIEQTLRQEAHFARSPAERRNQIPSVLRSLTKQRRVA